MTPYEAAYAIGEAKENFCTKTEESNYPMDFYAHDSLGEMLCSGNYTTSKILGLINNNITRMQTNFCPRPRA